MVNLYNVKGANIFKIKFKLREIRNLKHKTQKALARETGLSQAHISELELEKESPTLRVVESISNALGVHPYELLEIE